ncbi:hypothetical protein WA026_007631 [Henosepilachna vigintioctopunctata]|uniref:Immunoglobulin I-set domain-containing protein n=1 Tax=Henosepilachna vigintioctopunctata TaxID=420089 RepID=A0AAW1U5T2_9CUCU
MNIPGSFFRFSNSLGFFKKDLLYLKRKRAICYRGRKAYEFRMKHITTQYLFGEDVEIFQNVSGGIIMSDHSLVLQSVTRATVGEYRCVATNAEGKGSSNPIKLVVRCEYSNILHVFVRNL